MTGRRAASFLSRIWALSTLQTSSCAAQPKSSIRSAFRTTSSQFWVAQPPVDVRNSRPPNRLSRTKAAISLAFASVARPAPVLDVEALLAAPSEGGASPAPAGITSHFAD